ncbi:MAG: sialidase family protein [Verrucomicrobiota bacterium]
MKTITATAALLFALLFPLSATDEDNDGVTWLVEYDGQSLPNETTWEKSGQLNATITDGTLHLEDGPAAAGNYRASWKAAPDQEIVVEAKVEMGAMTGWKKGASSKALWPWRDGAPVGLLISDGRHQEGLVFYPVQTTSFTDRFIPMDTTNRFHTYRLVIRGTNMSISVDGVKKVTGQNAFWKPASSPQAFIQFGSTAKVASGDAHWASIRLGVRKPKTQPEKNLLKITISESWEIPRDDAHQTRPYLYDLGQNLLLMSVAQGSDAFYEHYGLLKSTDAGKSWSPIEGLDKKSTTPLPVLRRPDGSIRAMSRWTWLLKDGSVQGKTFHLDARANTFSMSDNTIILPAKYTNEIEGDKLVVERHIWNDEDGAMTMVVWSRKAVPISDGRMSTERMSHLVKSSDDGKTWNYVSTIGPGGEPAVARLTATELTAVIRGARTSQMTQTFSHDGGATWDKPIALEVGRVAPDLVFMSNGVLACSYGRPASCIMFSIDGGKTWCSHRVVSDSVGFNYCSIREISPGRLLLVHDAPKMNAVYIDVQRLDQ